jgi:hypothetical protein
MTLQKDTLIAIIGVTGAGKTTFVSKAAGRTDMRISSGLSSCQQYHFLISQTSANSSTGTQNIETARVQIDGKWVTLIDTPGFDDSDRTDVDILKLIADYLVETYQNNILLTGIILLQPISGNRVLGSERRRTRLFEKVCGPNAYQNIVIATTMWSAIESEEIGNERMTERAREMSFWGAMVEQGARVTKHDNTPQSAQEILRMLIHKQVVPLQMQEELARNGGSIGETSAGQQLDADLGAKCARFAKELEGLKRESIENEAEIMELKGRVEDVERERGELRESKVRCAIFLGAIMELWMAASPSLRTVDKLRLLKRL